MKKELVVFVLLGIWDSGNVTVANVLRSEIEEAEREREDCV